MDITPIISELVILNECVILRGFGGFDSQYLHAEYDSQHNKILPPRKKIIFRADWIKDNEQLKLALVNKLDITNAKADEIIDQYVSELFNKLKDNGSVEIIGVGKFTFDEHHRIQFFEADNITFLADSYGLGPLKIENKNKVEVLPTSTSVKKVTEPVKRKHTGWIVVGSMLLLVTILSLIVYFSGLKGFSIFGSGQATNAAKETEIVVFGAKSRSETDSLAKVIALKLDDKSQVKNALAIQKPETKIASQSEFILIAGTFKSLKNAEKYRKKLQTKGVKADILVSATQYKITLGAYNNKPEALNVLNRLQRELNQTIWLMEKKP